MKWKIYKWTSLKELTGLVDPWAQCDEKKTDTKGNDEEQWEYHLNIEIGLDLEKYYLH